MVAELERSVSSSFPSDDFAAIYIELKAQRRLFAMFLAEIEDSGRVDSLSQRLRRLRFGAVTLDRWKDADKKLEKTSSGGGSTRGEPAFSERWEIDIYAETALFTVRVLAEGGAYETAHAVAQSSIARLKVWIKRWKTAYGGETSTHYFTFSPKTVRYQVATLLAWKAYCASQMYDDTETKARTQALNPTYFKVDYRKDTSESTIQEAIDASLRYVPRHPLALFVQALLYRRQGRNKVAVDELHRLLTAMAPYDPNNQIANWQPFAKNHPEHPIPEEVKEEGRNDDDELEKYWRLSPRERMARHEQVSGGRQYEYVVNLTSIHRLIARLHEDSGDLRLSVEHLLSAVALSPHWDVDADILLQIARLLERQNRFYDAQAVVAALHSYRLLLEPNTLSTTRILEARVLNCILYARLGQHALGRDAARALLDAFKIETESFNAAGRYKERLPHYRLKGAFENLLVHTKILEQGKILETPYQLLSSSTESDSETEGWTSLLDLASLGFDPRSMADTIELMKASFSLDSSSMEEGYKPLGNPETVLRQPPELNINLNIAIRLLYALTKDAARAIEHVCQIDNNFVFNSIQINVGNRENEAEALDRPEGITLERRIKRAIERMHKLYKASKDHPHAREHAVRYKENLANYYDTQGWLEFRSAKSEDAEYEGKLMNAIHWLEQALDSNPRSSIVNYHLARVYLRLIEHLWQHTPFSQSDFQAAIKAGTINYYLSQALRYWMAGREHDSNRRLTDSLGWLGRRIQRYRSAWDRRHIRTFSGEDRPSPGS
ncbi:MAG: hypothetical protein IPK19_17650 [Chloroflexi bacterium]|nr:hypothetical protein [Chloroflexota bacterium]